MVSNLPNFEENIRAQGSFFNYVEQTLLIMDLLPIPGLLTIEIKFLLCLRENLHILYIPTKVEKFLKGSLDSIPSNYGWESLLVTAKHCWALSTNF